MILHAMSGRRSNFALKMDAFTNNAIVIFPMTINGYPSFGTHVSSCISPPPPRLRCGFRAFRRLQGVLSFCQRE
jgi:hypothetical protein